MSIELYDQIRPENRAEVEARCVQILFARARMAALLAPAGTLFIFWVAHAAVALPLAIGWMIVNTLPDALTFVLAHRSLRHPPQGVHIRSALNGQIILRILQGASWGAATVVFHGQGAAAAFNEMIILVVLASISATSVVNMAPSFRTLAGFCASLLLVPILYYFWLGDMTHVQIALGLIILLLIELQFGWDAYRQFAGGVHQLVLNQRIQRELEVRNEELDQANRRLREIAIHDGLTGLFNRRHMVDQLARQREAFLRHGHPCSIVLFDVDHFKQVNDRYGHPVGDRVLVELGKRVQGLLRQGDVLGRYGGEEFMLILPMSDLAAAMQLTERVRQALAESALVNQPEAIVATASFGVAQLKLGEEADDWLLRADEALYRAKHQGRNCVMG